MNLIELKVAERKRRGIRARVVVENIECTKGGYSLPKNMIIYTCDCSYEPLSSSYINFTQKVVVTDTKLLLQSYSILLENVEMVTSRVERIEKFVGNCLVIVVVCIDAEVKILVQEHSALQHYILYAIYSKFALNSRNNHTGIVEVNSAQEFREMLNTTNLESLKVSNSTKRVFHSSIDLYGELLSRIGRVLNETIVSGSTRVIQRDIQQLAILILLTNNLLLMLPMDLIFKLQELEPKTDFIFRILEILVDTMARFEDDQKLHLAVMKLLQTIKMLPRILLNHHTVLLYKLILNSNLQSTAINSISKWIVLSLNLRFSFDPHTILSAIKLCKYGMEYDYEWFEKEFGVEFLYGCCGPMRDGGRKGFEEREQKRMVEIVVEMRDLVRKRIERVRMH